MKIPKLQTTFQPIDIFADKAEYDRQKWLREHTMTHYTDKDYFTGSQTRLKGITVTGNKPARSYSGYSEPLPRRVQSTNISDITKGIHAVANPALAWFSPSQYVGAFRDTDNASDWFRSMMRGNSGFVTKEFEEKHPWISLATNMAGDVTTLGGTAKGFKYASDIIPRVAQFGVSNHTGNWTRFGNNMYRLKPGYAGMNSFQVERRTTVTPEDLANRKFFPVEEYGSEPIYTRETAPTRIKVKEGDITESHMNDGTPGSEVTDANKVANEWFNNANHGQSVSYETDYSLSTDSYPIALLKMNRWQQQGLGQFVESESAPQWMRLNRLGNKSFEELQKAINRVNKLTGQNYKIKQMLSPMIGANGQPTLHPITKQPLMAKGIYVQPVGFFKYKKGSKIHANI